MGEIADYMIEGLIDGTLDEDGVVINPEPIKHKKKFHYKCDCGFSFWGAMNHIGICNRCLKSNKK